MTPKRYQRVKEVFARACALPPSQRVEYLAQACGDDAALRGEVESLLEHDERTLPVEPRISPDSALAQLAARMAEGSSARAGLEPVGTPLPSAIGPYRIVREIGRGGMGVVYEAEQDNPRRTIALKVIRPGMVSAQLLRRFELEAQVLGRLQHPGIAQVYEAGKAQVDVGGGVKVDQPYFAMEHVRGEPLSTYLARRKLPTRVRLALFVAICEAVQHAHQKGVVHRDLKPGNILVDQQGQPKILDFGVALTTDADVQVTTVHTDVGQLIGTLPYMSPEQIAGNSREIDTRSDVYALGVLCYQMLAERLPYALQDKTIPEAARIIVEEDPAPLSAVNRLFRGDLEAIVTKALEKEKPRRYQSASDLAADVRRYLADQPVLARPVTAFYQLRKFARRNRALVAGVVGVFVVLVLGTAVSTGLAIRALRAEGLAEARRAQAEEARGVAERQRAEATLEAARASALGGFLMRMLKEVSPEQAQGRDVALLRGILDAAAADIDAELGAYPDVRADIHQVIGMTYRSISLYDEAEDHLQAALDLGARSRGAEAENTLIALRGLAEVRWNQGRLDEAEQMFAELVATYAELRGALHRDTLLLRYDRAGVWRDQGRTAEAEVELREVLALMRAHLPPEDDARYTAMNGVAALRVERGEVTEETEQLLRAVLARWTEVHGRQHPKSVSVLRNLAAVVRQRGDLPEAERLTREALELHEAVFGPGHHETIRTQVNLAVLLRERGQLAEAEEVAREAYARAAEVLGPEHPDTLKAIANLGVVLRAVKKYDEARLYLEQAVDLSEQLVGPEHPDTLNRLSSLAGLLYMQDRFAEAEPVMRKVVAGLRATQGERSFGTLAAMNNLGMLLVDLGKFEEAAALLEETIVLADQAAPPGHWFRWEVRANHGRCLMNLERYVEAEELLLACRAGLSESLGPEHKRVRDTEIKLADLYRAWGRPDEAARYAESEGTP